MPNILFSTQSDFPARVSSAAGSFWLPITTGLRQARQQIEHAHKMTTLSANHNADHRPRTWIYLVFIFTGLNAYALLIAFARYLSYPGSEFTLVTTIYYVNLYLSVAWVIMTPVVIFVARRFPQQEGDWIKPLTIHLTTLGLFLILHLTFWSSMTSSLKIKVKIKGSDSMIAQPSNCGFSCQIV